MRGAHLLLAFSFLLAAGVGASGYVLLGTKWSFTPVTMHLELGSSGTLMDGSPSWDVVAAQALGTWNYYLLRLQFTAVMDTLTPGNGDGVNNVSFAKTIYGADFGDAVAVTTDWDEPGEAGTRREADVIFNADLNWNSYRGPLQATSSGYVLYDLRRVALHEFGHVVGLNHPDAAGQSVTAVMNSAVSDTDGLQSDDIRGGQFLYGAQAGTVPEDAALATIDRPKRSVVTASSLYQLLGSADAKQVITVYLVNSRFGKKFSRATGVRRWKASLPLKVGRNQISLYIRDLDGIRKKVMTRLVTRKT